MVATTQMNKRLDEVYRRRSEILSDLADSGPESLSESGTWLENISRPGDLGVRIPVTRRPYASMRQSSP